MPASPVRRRARFRGASSRQVLPPATAPIRTAAASPARMSHHDLPDRATAPAATSAREPMRARPARIVTTLPPESDLPQPPPYARWDCGSTLPGPRPWRWTRRSPRHRVGRTMGGLRVGDEVFGVDGAPCRVLAATPEMLGRLAVRSSSRTGRRSWATSPIAGRRRPSRSSATSCSNWSRAWGCGP
jgi:hypothetical protein